MLNTTAPGPGDNSELSGQIVPFGKYKDRPVADLTADDGYREWVLSQPGLLQMLQDKHPVFYQILVHGGPPPDYSPEHNEMQARFLDENWCLGLARLIPGMAGHGLDTAAKQVHAWRGENLAVNPDLVMSCEANPASARDIRFEDHGWDVTFRYTPAAISQDWKCECEARPCDCWRDHPDLTFYNNGAGPVMTTQDWGDERYKPTEPKKPYCPRPVAPDWPRELPAGTYDFYKKERDEYPGKVAKYREDLAQYPDILARQAAQYGKDLVRFEERLACYKNSRHYALDHRLHRDTFRNYAAELIAAELKPDLGDDYPAVLRQIQKYMVKRERMNPWDTRSPFQDVPTCDAAFLVVRRARFTSVTWDQVEKIFARSGIILVPESWLAAPS